MAHGPKHKPIPGKRIGDADGAGDFAMAAASVQAPVKKSFDPLAPVDAAAGYLSAGLGMASLGAFVGPLAMGGVAGAAGLMGAKSTQAKIEGSLKFLHETNVNQLNVSPGLRNGASKTAHALAGVASVPLGAVAKVPGLGVFKPENIKSLPKQIGETPLLHAAMNTAFIGMSGLQTYQVTREFSGLVQSLRELEADLTGKNIDDISSSGVLTGSVSKTTAAVRSQMLKTTGTHMFSAAAGLGINIGMAFGGRIHNMAYGLLPMLMFQLPEMIDQAAEGMFGQSPLPFYASLAAAHKAGQEIPAETYQEFLLLASEKLRSRGRKGKEFAAELARQYAEEKLSPAEVLREVTEGKMQERIDAITEKNKHAPQTQSFAQRELARKDGQPALKVAVRPELAWAEKERHRAEQSAMKPPTIN